MYLGLLFVIFISLIFLDSPAWASVTGVYSPVAVYLVKVSLAILFLGVSAFFFLRWSPLKNRVLRHDGSIITSLPVGRDVIYIVRCGPEVLVLLNGRSGSSLLRSYSLEEWNSSQPYEYRSEDEKT